jgi:hypothetical protein
MHVHLKTKIFFLGVTNDSDTGDINDTHCTQWTDNTHCQTSVPVVHRFTGSPSGLWQCHPTLLKTLPTAFSCSSFYELIFGGRDKQILHQYLDCLKRTIPWPDVTVLHITQFTALHFLHRYSAKILHTLYHTHDCVALTSPQCWPHSAFICNPGKTKQETVTSELCPHKEHLQTWFTSEETLRLTSSSTHLPKTTWDVLFKGTRRYTSYTPYIRPISEGTPRSS